MLYPEGVASISYYVNQVVACADEPTVPRQGTGWWWGGGEVSASSAWRSGVLVLFVTRTADASAGLMRADANGRSLFATTLSDATHGPRVLATLR